MERWRKMLRAIQNSSTMRLMLVAQTRIHYSAEQEDILNICVNTACASTWKFVGHFKAGWWCLTGRKYASGSRIMSVLHLLPLLWIIFSGNSIKYNSKICVCTESPFGTTHKATSQRKIMVINFACVWLKTFYIGIWTPKNSFHMITVMSSVPKGFLFLLSKLLLRFRNDALNVCC